MVFFLSTKLASLFASYKTWKETKLVKSRLFSTTIWKTNQSTDLHQQTISLVFGPINAKSACCLKQLWLIASNYHFLFINSRKKGGGTPWQTWCRRYWSGWFTQKKCSTCSETDSSGSGGTFLTRTYKRNKIIKLRSEVFSVCRRFRTTSLNAIDCFNITCLEAQ